jgi:hypothetical protein
MLKAFNNLRVTYGWCYSPQDAEALEVSHAALIWQLTVGVGVLPSPPG